MSLLEQKTTRKEWVDKIVTELDAGNSKEYKMETIWDNAIYTKKLEISQLPNFYYLIVWKGYFKRKNIWKPVLVIQHLKKLISSFHQDYPKKPIATFLLVNSVLLMAKPIVKPTAKSTTKQKRGQPANSANKRAIKN